MSDLEKTTSHGAIVRWKSPLEGNEHFSWAPDSAMIWTSGKLLSGLNLLTSIISQVGLVNRQKRFMHSMHVIHMSSEYPLYTRKITSFPLFHYNPTHSGSPRMNSLWLGGTCGTTQSGDPLSRDRNSGLPTCLSPLKQCWSGPWTNTSSTVGKTTTLASYCY